MNKPAKSEFPELMDVDEVAEVLRVGVHTVRRLCKADPATGAAQLRSLKIGGQTKIAKHDLWVYLRQARQTTINQANKLERSSETVIPAIDVREGDEVSIGDDS